IHHDLHAFPTRRSSDLTDAKDDLAVSRTKWNIFGRRDRAIARATTAIAGAELAIKQQTERAQAAMRDRLMHAKMDESLQEYALRSEEHTSELQSPDHLV